MKTIGSKAFTGCSNLMSLSYQGSSDPVLNMTAFFGDNNDALSMICVDINYNSTIFCGRNITCKSESCGSVVRGSNECYEVSMNGNECIVKQKKNINQCYDYITSNDECIIKKKLNVSEWESRTDECMSYVCHNESGRLSWKKCRSIDETTGICLNEECVNDDSSTAEQWPVLITTFPVEPYGIMKELSIFTGIEISDLRIEQEDDVDGKVNRVILLVEDENTARRITESINKCVLGRDG